MTTKTENLLTEKSLADVAKTLGKLEDAERQAVTRAQAWLERTQSTTRFTFRDEDDFQTGVNMDTLVDDTRETVVFKWRDIKGGHWNYFPVPRSEIVG